MWLVLSTLALAAPPSSTLTGPTGTLAWTVQSHGDTVRIEGRSPKWTVEHDARADLTPLRTKRVANGETVTVEYTREGATVTLPSGDTVVHTQAGIWDGDTLDVRLGQRYADGKPAVSFQAIDTGSGKLYGFNSRFVGEETCGAAACGHVRVQLAGMLRMVGPTFDYWFAKDGGLLRFEGPAGSFGP